MKSSILARPSPRQILRPVRDSKGRVLSAKKRTTVRKFISPTSRKWQESLSFHKLSIFVQKVRRIKVAWLLPLSLIIQDRGQQRIDSGALQMRQKFKYVSDVLLLQKSGESDLLDEETLKSDILAGFVRKCHGDNVGYSLSLMDDSICEGKALPVFNLNLTRSYHPVQLLLDLV